MSRPDLPSSGQRPARRRGAAVVHSAGTEPAASRTLAALVGTAAAGTYLVGAAALATVAGPGLAREAYPFLPLAAASVVGLPVALWLRYDRRGPLAILCAVIAFWHGYVPLFEPGVETPGFVLALYFAPVYLLAYLLAGASERGLARALGYERR